MIIKCAHTYVPISGEPVYSQRCEIDRGGVPLIAHGCVDLERGRGREGVREREGEGGRGREGEGGGEREGERKKGERGGEKEGGREGERGSGRGGESKHDRV